MRLSTDSSDRRGDPDRRRKLLRALWVGAFKRRRRNPRRPQDARLTSVDWHHPQWLAVGIFVMLLCCADAFLTLTLIDHGANEVNPFMLPLIGGGGRSFALWKLGLTALGVTVLILLARAKAFGWIPVGVVLYGILTLYVGLVAYELWLLDQLVRFS